ncbi:DUF1127 domain-containing protein [Thalassococcus sp. BH17M4-6]|uniref:DUF1127 domain-containing protein n=1 Tax=Thalassococcus sp. BH17M4-6 TaxID=3413148 RepID=UPI003BE8100E
MAYTTEQFLSHTSSVGSIAKNALVGVGAAFNRFWEMLLRASERNHRYRTVQALNAMSDEKLAARGIKRENIVRHVYRDLFYI